MSDWMNVPFLDLKAQYASIRQEIASAVEAVLESNSYILGKHVEDFEKNFAGFCSAKDCAAVNSGTAALHLALLAHGVKPGDEVITTPHTFIATAEAISHCGAKPVFVDIEPDTMCINPELVSKAVTKRTKAILPVHLYGHPADMKPMAEIAERKGLALIEDCCQAHGAEYNGKRVPAYGTGCFSFYPSKNLGAYGEGGAVVSNDPEITDKARLLRAHGERPKNTHSVVGYNYRLEGLQGAILNAKFKHLDAWTNSRRENARKYSRLLKGTSLVLPMEKSYGKHVYHLYVVRSERRDALQQFLSGKGIGTGIHYPVPVHMQQAYAELKYKKGSMPLAETHTARILSLPMFPELSDGHMQYVADAMMEFERGTGK